MSLTSFDSCLRYVIWTVVSGRFITNNFVWFYCLESLYLHAALSEKAKGSNNSDITYKMQLLTCFHLMTLGLKKLAWLLYLYLSRELKWVFWGEISVCAAVHTCYVINMCDRVQSIILLSRMVGMSFMPVMLTRLNVSKPEHWVTWAHITGVNFPFFREKQSNNTLAHFESYQVFMC